VCRSNEDRIDDSDGKQRDLTNPRGRHAHDQRITDGLQFRQGPSPDLKRASCVDVAKAKMMSKGIQLRLVFETLWALRQDKDKGIFYIVDNICAKGIIERLIRIRQAASLSVNALLRRTHRNPSSNYLSGLVSPSFPMQRVTGITTAKESGKANGDCSLILSTPRQMA